MHFSGTQQGIEGYFRTIFGEEIPVSFKNTTTVTQPKNIFRVIRENADQIIAAERIPFGRHNYIPSGTLQKAEIYVNSPQFSRSEIINEFNSSQINPDTGFRNALGRATKFKIIYIKTKDGVITIENGIVKPIGWV